MKEYLARLRAYIDRCQKLVVYWADCPPIPWPARVYLDAPTFYRRDKRFDEWEAAARWDCCKTNSYSRWRLVATLRALYGVIVFRLFRKYAGDASSAWWYRW